MKRGRRKSHSHLIHITSTSHPHHIHISSTSHPHLIHISSLSSFSSSSSSSDTVFPFDLISQAVDTVLPSPSISDEDHTSITSLLHHLLFPSSTSSSSSHPHIPFPIALSLFSRFFDHLLSCQLYSQAIALFDHFEKERREVMWM